MKAAIAAQTPLYLAVLLLSLLMAWGCGKKTDVTGKWEGTLDVSNSAQAQGKSGRIAFRIVLNIRKEGDQLRASLASPDEGPGEISADTIEFKDGSLYVKISKRMATYEAKLDSDGAELHGNFKQEPYDIPLALKRSTGF